MAKIVTLWEHEFLAAEESDIGALATARDAAGATVAIRADYVINAAGFDVAVVEPLATTTTAIRSITPETCDAIDGEIARDDKPVWVIGSGKTAMDTALSLIAAHPGREINMLAGSGTLFAKRDVLYPAGIRRWWRGTRPNVATQTMADWFDGTNESAVIERLRQAPYGHSITRETRHFMLGILSAEEANRAKEGLTNILDDHYVDAIDGPDGPRLVLRSGQHIEVPDGSWLINCTGHFPADGTNEITPYISPGGRILTVATTSMFGFSSFAGYFLTQLLLAGKILEVPLYEADFYKVKAVAQPAVALVMVTTAQYNLILTFNALGAEVFKDFGLDFDRWYPVPRQIAGQLKFAVGRNKRAAKYRAALDTLAARTGARIGPRVGADAAA